MNISIPRDNNRITVIAGTSSSDGVTPTLPYVNPNTHRLLVDLAGGISGSGTTNEIAYFTGSTSIGSLTTATYPSLTELSYVKGVTSSIQTQINSKGTGTVTSVSVVTANGVSGSVATATTTPVITLTLGAITPTTVNGLTITANGTNTLNIAVGKTVVHSAGTTFAGTDGKTLTISNSIALAGTDSTVMTFPSTSATIARIDAAQTFTGIQTFSTPIATASVATMTATVGGGVPTPPNNTTTFLRGDGTFATPTSSASTTKVGATTRANDAASGTQTIAHGLGRTPSNVFLSGLYFEGNDTQTLTSDGGYDGTNNASRYGGNISQGATAYGIDTTNGIRIARSSTIYQAGIITMDATNITITWTRTGSTSTGTIQIFWSVF